ncbi:hypothetical protein JAAARDRAFT_331682 [Jaapia argillacea MUCL 33604]|uniref:Uncharacterized protein n=1 Tax=Jaapia argillacea MUCL 33604 TaxID=933084 RepID=A0A067PPY1_9AGAM|nr:hypothetical protein JAAARDRAFT_331682 [Jaapia argillacea MUCL 33604]
MAPPSSSTPQLCNLFLGALFRWCFSLQSSHPIPPQQVSIVTTSYVSFSFSLYSVSLQSDSIRTVQSSIHPPFVCFLFHFLLYHAFDFYRTMLPFSCAMDPILHSLPCAYFLH